MEIPNGFFIFAEKKMNFQEKYKNEQIGLYFMFIYKKIDKDLSFFRSDRDRVCSYYFMLGCACQGRIKEVENHYNNILNTEESELVVSHLISIKNLLFEIANKASIILKQPIKGIIIGESIGDYEDRKLRSNTEFMKLYDTLREIYITDIIKFFQIKKIS